MSTIRSGDGTRIAYTTAGSGPVVLLVDGALGYRGYYGGIPLAEALADRSTVIAYDRRGRGESGDTQPYAVAREIEDIAALIDAAGGRACLFGTSSGAALALRAAAALGAEKVARLALYEPPYNSDEQQAVEEFAAYNEQLHGLLAAGKRGDAIALFLADALPADELENMRSSPDWPWLEALAPTLAYESAILGDGVVPVDLARTVSVPVLVLTGGASLDFFGQVADTLTDSLPAAERKTLAGQTHQASPDVLAPVLIAFYSA